MDILISNLLSELIFDFGKWSNWKYTTLCVVVQFLSLVTIKVFRLVTIWGIYFCHKICFFSFVTIIVFEFCHIYFIYIFSHNFYFTLKLFQDKILPSNFFCHHKTCIHHNTFSSCFCFHHLIFFFIFVIFILNIFSSQILFQTTFYRTFFCIILFFVITLWFC